MLTPCRHGFLKQRWCIHEYQWCGATADDTFQVISTIWDDLTAYMVYEISDRGIAIEY